MIPIANYSCLRDLACSCCSCGCPGLVCKTNHAWSFSAGPLLSDTDKLSHLVTKHSTQFEKESTAASAKGSDHNVLLPSLLRSHTTLMLQQCGWTVLESLFRLLSPVGLRQFIMFLRAFENAEQEIEEWRGWMWACLLIGFQLGLALTHHQLFWTGMRFGFLLKQQACLSAPLCPFRSLIRPCM